MGKMSAALMPRLHSGHTWTLATQLWQKRWPQRSARSTRSSLQTLHMVASATACALLNCSSLGRSLLPLWYLPALTKFHRPFFFFFFFFFFLNFFFFYIII